MQDYMLAFTRSPNSLPSLGWPLFNPNATDGGLLLEFGNGTTVKNITGDYYALPGNKLAAVLDLEN
ncbi:hypothetical protein D0865_03440 [Hortaea werneckii]|uniref:Uncharacterized protein n=1 Tax=Hortaea werneckii TaxID=91943 RepID=A0A3M7CXW1_HORWE|nr:hypothetical protein D0865_03440 [Hortaea werneckii]